MKKDAVKKILDMSETAFLKGEVPVAAAIVKNGEIISIAHNSRIEDKNPIMHAEVKCIIKTCKKIKDWRLDDCDLYVTLEPCHMCKEIIKECRIKNVYYIVDSKYKNINKTNFLKIESIYSNNYEKMLTNFFKSLR